MPTYKSVSAIRLKDFAILSSFRDMKVRERERERELSLLNWLEAKVFEDGFLSRIIPIEKGLFLVFYGYILNNLNLNRSFL